MGEFRLWEFYGKFVDRFQQIVYNYLLQNMFIVRSMNPYMYQKSTFMQIQIPEQKKVFDASLLVRQLLGNDVLQFNALEGLT